LVSFSWKSHYDQLLPKLSGACYAIRVMFQEILKMVYYSYFHSIMGYWSYVGETPQKKFTFSNLKKKKERKAVRIITGFGNRDSCRELFKELQIHPLQSQLIFSLLLFVVKNVDQCKFTLDLHGINTRQTDNLYQPLSNLSV
jgi:hypothetical protein